MNNFWTVYGLIQINTETHIIEGEDIKNADKIIDKNTNQIIGISFNSTVIPFDEVTKPVKDSNGNIIGIETKFSEIVVDGETRPILKIPSDQIYGWKRLTAIYSDDFKQIYLGTIRRTLVYYGAKVWINCPCVMYGGEKTITFKADLFAHNRRVPGEVALFYYLNDEVPLGKVDVVDGHVELTVPVDDLEIINKSKFKLKFEPSFFYELAPAVGEGVVFVKEGNQKTPLTVDVTTTIANDNEWVKLVARVYRKNHEKYINFPGDLPGGGYVIFYLDGQKIWSQNNYKWYLNEAGYASVPIKPSMYFGRGTHNITAIYYPDTPELQAKYVETTGCGTLFLGDDKNKPSLTNTSRLCTYIGNSNKEIVFNSNRNLNGLFELILDGIILATSRVNNTRSVTLSFDTLGDWKQNVEYLWNFPGHHNLILKYSTDDGGSYPMEYWYYLDDFFIQTPINIELVGDIDTNSQTVNGENVYVGNNLYYINSNGKYVWYSPMNNREKSTTLGNKVKVKVTDTLDKKNKVNEGYLRFTFVTRTEENNMEEHIN